MDHAVPLSIIVVSATQYSWCCEVRGERDRRSNHPIFVQKQFIRGKVIFAEPVSHGTLAGIGIE